MKLKIIIFGVALLLSSSTISAQKILLTANYSDAKIYTVIGSTILKPALGTGSAELKLEKGSVNRIVVMKEGFEPLIQEFPKTRKWPKEITLTLENRMVEISTQPFDADIYVNGTNVGREKYNLILPAGKSLTIELRKEGFEALRKTYYNQDGHEDPPFKDNLTLINKSVSVSVVPTDAKILVNGNFKGNGSEDVIIHENECVTVKVEKEGYESKDYVFCNKKKEAEPPVSYDFILNNRIVKLKTTPESAQIKFNGKVVGEGEYEIKVPNGECVEVIVLKDGYVRKKLNYCNSDEYQEPPVNDHIEMAEDEAYNTSVETDMANTNVTLEVDPNVTEGEAWKLVSSIVMAQFDVLEVTDKETGYIRTAWQVQSFNGETTIRTRLILKMADSNPLKYMMKISSEFALGVVSVKEDQEFEEWNRILKRYSYIIEEAQARLK